MASEPIGPKASSVETITVAVSDVERAVQGILLALGVPAADASIQTRWLVEAELRGHPSHGLQRLRVLVPRLERGLANAVAAPKFDWASRSVLLVDGDRGLGPVVGLTSIDALIERAPGTGTAIAAVRDTNHLGLLAPYVERCAEAGLIGIALTTSEALVHPWGGRTALVGTNPIAIAVPASPGPFVLDMATGAVSMGKVLAYGERGIPLEDGWAIDGEGRPTRDAAAAALGAISPFGGAKGYALALAIELLVASLTRTALGTDVRGTLDSELECTKGDLFICIHPATFGVADVSGYVSTYLEGLRSSLPQPGSLGVAVPGDRSRRERATRLARGIALPVSLWHDLAAMPTVAGQAFG